MKYWYANERIESSDLGRKPSNSEYEVLDQSFEFGFGVCSDSKAISDFFVCDPFFQFFDGKPYEGINAFILIRFSDRRKFGIEQSN